MTTSEASIEIREEWYYHGIWYVTLHSDPKQDPIGDFMACLWREGATGPWVWRGRLRMYDSEHPGPWGGHDEKHWFGMRQKEGTVSTEADGKGMAKGIQELAEDLAAQGHGTVRFVNIQGDGTRASYYLMQENFVHVKGPIRNKEEAEKAGVEWTQPEGIGDGSH